MLMVILMMIIIWRNNLHFFYSKTWSYQLSRYLFASHSNFRVFHLMMLSISLNVLLSISLNVPLSISFNDVQYFVEWCNSKCSAIPMKLPRSSRNIWTPREPPSPLLNTNSWRSRSHFVQFKLSETFHRIVRFPKVFMISQDSVIVLSIFYQRFSVGICFYFTITWRKFQIQT